MDPLDEMVARICGTMDRIGDMLTREADDMHALSVGVGQAIEAQTATLAAVQEIADAERAAA